MPYKNHMSTIFHILLSFGVFLSFSVLLGRIFGAVLPALAGWVTDLAAFLMAYTAAVFLCRKNADERTPSKILPKTGLWLSFAYVGAGMLALVVAMFLVLVIFPVTGDEAAMDVVPQLLTAVCIHPVLEEILFRQVFLGKLLTLSEPETAEEIIPVSADETAPLAERAGMDKAVQNHRAGVLFAVLTQAILFGLAHLGSGGMLYGFAGGVILGWLMLRTGRLWVPVLCHMLLNLRSTTWDTLSDTVSPVVDIVLCTIGLVCLAVLWLHWVREHTTKHRRLS